MEDCIFCKIIKGEIPSYKVYEDEDILAVLDINPSSDGHTLVFPKKHTQNFEDTDEETLSKLMVVVKKIGLAIKNNLGADSYNVCENNDLIAGQIVPHIHFHIVPRYKGDGLQAWTQAPYPDGKAEEILKKIKIK